MIEKFLAAAVVAASGTMAAYSQAPNKVFPISPVEMIMPNDMVFIDMATNAAKKSKADGGKADGAVIVKNNKEISKGTPLENVSAIASAINNAGETPLAGAVVYVINQPSVKDLVALSNYKIKTVYFVNGQNSVIAAGIVDAAAYSQESIPADIVLVPMKQMEYPDAQQLVSK